MKSFQQFMNADEKGRIHILAESGTWLASRVDKYNSYDLYDLSGVYVEIKVSLRNCERCYYLFTDTAGIASYLAEIDISPIQ